MYLKSIEIQGFKSFANKMSFEFHNGITAIVGPNGSGKSNVADAVRWVLGEQKVKQLRGSKMEDVIFSGTESRKPLGFAYVAITLDNSDSQLQIDFDEVKISRRIFRSGESEYKINGSTCRLKDISELFYDTGIGKEGYSIIGQGQIEKILSEKPEDRRELFDEAAGIVKFKRRKAVTIKKLEEERQNLVRVRDILNELGGQLEPLRKQSEAAKSYLKLKDRLKIADIQIFLSEATDIQKKKERLTEKFDAVSGDIEESRSNLDKTKSEYEQSCSLIEELTIHLEEKRKLHHDKTLEKEKFEGEINVINEQINSIRSSDLHVNERLNGISKKMGLLEDQKREFNQQRDELELELSEASASLQNAEENFAKISSLIAAVSSGTDELKGEIIENLNEKSNLRSKIQRFDTMLEQVLARKAELNSLAQKGSIDLEDTIAAKELLRSEYEKEGSALKRTTEEAETAHEEIASLKNQLNNLGKNLQDIQNSYHREKSRLESLKNIIERYDGYGNSIQKVMEQKEHASGIIGVVADIIQADREYETAIETALGGSLRNIVTDTEKTAKTMVEFLKRNKFGRATFLPLESIEGKSENFNSKLISEPGFIGIASTLVRTEDKYSNIARFLLGRIIVVDNIDNALKIASKYKYSLRIVTLEGEQLNPGGSISGGAFRNTGSLLGRRREMEELEESVRVHKSRSEELLSETKLVNEKLAHLESAYEMYKKTMQEHFLLINKLEMNLKLKEERIRDLEDKQKNSYFENSELKKQIEEIEEEKNKLSQKLSIMDARSASIEDEITLKSGELDGLQDALSLQARGNEEIRLSHAGIKQKKDFIASNIRRIENEIKILGEEMAAINREHSNSALELHDKLTKTEELKRCIQKIEDEACLLKAETENLENEKKSLSAGHKDFLDKRDAFSDRINELDKELLRLDGQLEKLQESFDNRADYIWNEYEITFNEAQKYPLEELISLVQAKRELDSIRTEIRSLGDININAIDEYKNVGERYSFLKGQHDDLAEAEESLVKVIVELDKGMRRQFSEQFDVIRSEFGKVFQELFGGGYGTLEMVENEDILDAGIVITAQPPGKKLQNVQLMSGGEKALTAISLLFAIQNLKPSPFCLLDEIEAALDDPNIDRFSQYLHKLCVNTQFIVITHRKGTMASADRLYGITMQEKGVSTQVSVNLEEFQLVT
ncbi:chromosome segregation protein SMC [Parasporobacterium paucivorans]|uniref:Chromosome partition protein Smc n=1 Tax=Parasporobacterium paucivorans DSM 15970 TaxID=1122934 RepID=A0A1M6F1K3_9FIRM|nr:chromosome segregation protein SMC [Parasporobacterium paucivorans]SHI91567.1 condensin subunit Smc [Parasporobacterium paucivorans DSM 15970]